MKKSSFHRFDAIINYFDDFSKLHEKVKASTNIIRVISCYYQGRRFSPDRIAKVVDYCHMLLMKRSMNPKIRKLTQASKISKVELALKIARSMKHVHRVPTYKQGNGSVGPLSIVGHNGKIRVGPHRLCLEWRS